MLGALTAFPGVFFFGILFHKSGETLTYDAFYEPTYTLPNTIFFFLGAALLPFKSLHF
jgi:hypothetical protein